jgi:hypothetical protein
MARKRMTLRESYARASEGDTRDATGGLATLVSAVWYWVFGEPQGDDLSPDD